MRSYSFMYNVIINIKASSIYTINKKYTRYIWEIHYDILIKIIEQYNDWGDYNFQVHQLQLMGGTNLLVSSAPIEGILQHRNSPSLIGRRLQPPRFYQLQLIRCYNTLIFQLQLEGGYKPLAHMLQPMILTPPNHPQQWQEQLSILDLMPQNTVNH